MLSLRLLHPRLELAIGKVLVAVVHCLELAAVDRHDRLGKQVQVSAKHHELPARAPDPFVVVLAEIRNRLLKSGDKRPVNQIN